MQFGVKKPVITADFVFERTDPFTIYRHYLGEFTVGTPFQNPTVSKQETPSFSVYLRDGKLWHQDFAVPETHGDCVALVQQMYSLDFHNALKKIAHDLGLTAGKAEYDKIVKSYVKPVLDEKKYTYIQVTVGRWRRNELEYWEQYGIGKIQLQQEEIYPVREWYLNRVLQQINDGELCFCYRFKNAEGYKIYYPNRKGKDKWKTNTGKVIENEECIERFERIIITKSRKDRIVLSNLFPQLGVISLQNESASSYTEELIKKLEGKQVWISFDSDPAGKKASKAMNEKYPFMKHVNVSDWHFTCLGCTDWADVYAEGLRDDIVAHFKLKNII